MMGGANNPMPSARTEELVIEDLLDETVVYDLRRDRAHCLNRTAVLVWRHCDGQTTVSEMAALLERELHVPADAGIVWMALDRLAKAHLLGEPLSVPAPQARYSRREVARRLRLIGGLAVVLPAVVSITAPTAAQALTPITRAECRAKPTSACGGNPCSDRNNNPCVFDGVNRCDC